MSRILTIAFLSAVVAMAATSAEAGRCLTANGASLNGASASAPLEIIAIDLPAH